MLRGIKPPAAFGGRLFIREALDGAAAIRKRSPNVLTFSSVSASIDLTNRAPHLYSIAFFFIRRILIIAGMFWRNGML